MSKRFKNWYVFACCRCNLVAKVWANSQIKAKIALQAQHRWGTTSMDSPTAKDACAACVKASGGRYAIGRPFKISPLALIGSGLGRVEEIRRMV